MRKLILAAGAAALSISMPAIAEKGGKGGGNGGGKPHAAQGHSGGNPGKAPKAHGGRDGGKAAHAERRSFESARGAGKPAKAERQAFRAPERAAKQERKVAKQAAKAQQRFIEDGIDSRRVAQRDWRDGSSDWRHAAGAGCPPGLAKKGNGCLPPGQAKKMFARGDRIEPSWWGAYNVPMQYRAFYPDTAQHYYRYDDGGYIYRIDSSSNLISGLVPLLGGGFAVGQPLPAGYDVYNVPVQYRDTWYDTDDSYYRYGDDAIYRVDAGSGIIESIVALLAGDLNVGQALPAGYDAYNVPLDYRDRYYDTDDSLYRYADGNIYQVDAKTQIIQAIVQMLV